MNERELTDDERDELDEASQRGLELLAIDDEVDADGLADALFAAVEAQAALAPANRRRAELAYELGALLGALCEGALAWELVTLVGAEDVEVLAAVSMDRAVVVLPLLLVDALLRGEAIDARGVWARLSAGERPPGVKRRDYAVVLP